MYERCGVDYMVVKSPWFVDWALQHVGLDADRRIPSLMLSAYANLVMFFMEGFTADKTKIGIDSNEDIWLLHLDNLVQRDGLALLLHRIDVDTLYREDIAIDHSEI